MAKKASSRWIGVFEEFIKDIRISSKESVSEDERGSPLVLWESQRRFLKHVADGLDDDIRIFNCLKSRQLGVTTISLAIDVLWLAMHPNLIGCLVADTEKNINANRSLIEKYVASFPDGYFGESFRVTKSNRSFIEFSNKSRLNLLVAGTKKKGVSWAEGVGYAFAHLTETSKYGDPDALASLEESFAQTNPNRLFIYESTANGTNHWMRRWQAGQKDLFTQKSFFLGWWSSDVNVIPRNDARFAQYGGFAASGEEREKVAAVARMYGHKITPEQLAWIRWKTEAGGSDNDLLDQNQPWTERDAFVESGYSFFQTRQVGNEIKAITEGGEEYGFQAYRYEIDGGFFSMKLERIEDPEQFERIELKVWEEPVPNGKYAIGFDPAWGRNDHKDRSVIEVYRCYADKVVQVAEYATADVELKHAAWCLAHLAGSYKDCVVIPEITGPGRALFMEWDHLKQMMQAEVYRDSVQNKHVNWEAAFENARWYLYSRPDSMGKGFAMGFETSWRTKAELMHQMRGEFVTKGMIVRSIPLLNEMLNVIVDEGGSIGAPESSSADMKDDRVFATALAIRAWINWIRPSMLSNGETYKRVQEEESGEVTPLNKSLNNIVFNFFRTQQEVAEMEPEKPTWLTDRGLI